MVVGFRLSRELISWHRDSEGSLSIPSVPLTHPFRMVELKGIEEAQVEPHSESHGLSQTRWLFPLEKLRSLRAFPASLAPHSKFQSYWLQIPNSGERAQPNFGQNPHQGRFPYSLLFQKLPNNAFFKLPNFGNGWRIFLLLLSDVP